MSNYLKNEIKHLPMIVVVSIIFCGINTLANNHLFNSKDVDYDNSNTHIESTNVGDAIDELFDAANNFTTYDTRLQGVETKVGTGTLNTTAQNLIGGVNELNGKITQKFNDLLFFNQTNVTTTDQDITIPAITNFRYLLIGYRARGSSDAYGISIISVEHLKYFSNEIHILSIKEPSEYGIVKYKNDTTLSLSSNTVGNRYIYVIGIRFQ